MVATLLETGKEDGDAVVILDWEGVEPYASERLTGLIAKAFVHSPIHDPITLADLHRGDGFAFTARFREAATLSVDFWCQYGAARKRDADE
jgi:hypothetical protein